MTAPLIAHDLEAMQCCSCDIVHAIPRVMHQTAQREGGFWHCQNGHSRGYENGTQAAELSRVRAELEAERERKTETLARANDAERDRTLTILHRERRRAVAGTCPCCKRTFRQLARHMAAKHPGHAQAAMAVEPTGGATRRSANGGSLEQA